VPAQGLADIMIQKNRHGPTDNIRIRFQSQYTRFTDLDFGLSNDSYAGITPNENFETIDSRMNTDYGDESQSNSPFAAEYPF
jgi:hypothetical protein